MPELGPISSNPLAPALRSYLQDRPHGPVRELWAGALLFFVLPGYYWIWYRRFNYDRKVAEVAALLEMGYPLHTALETVAGAAPRQTVLGAAVGRAIGRLDLGLRHAALIRLSTLWVELLPRLLYPLLLLFFILGVLFFWLFVIGPRVEVIFREFKIEMPEWTTRLFEYGELAVDYLWMPPVFVLAMVSGLILLILSPTIRWYFPPVAWFYRRNVQSRVLKMFAGLLEAKKPAPESLALLTDSGYFPEVVRKRLERVRHRVEQGEPLADSLRRGRLLPTAAVALVQAAERVGNLPWVLMEVADALANRMVRRLRRISLLLFPVTLLGIGGLVAFMALGMFLPLIEIMTRLGE